MAGSSLVDRVATWSLAVLTVCAVVLTVSKIRDQPTKPRRIGQAVKEWSTYSERGKGQVIGADEGAVTLVEFADFQCPFCASLAATVKDLQKEFGPDLRVVYRHYPLRGHPRAHEAALASECAAEQGRFGSFHDSLFSWQSELDTLTFSRAASAAGVQDIATFDQCVSASKYAARVDADIQDGQELRLQGTPTLLINSRRFDGIFGKEVLGEAIQAELSRARQ